MPRVMTDCRDQPSVSGCTLVIAGEPDEVVRAAVQHAIDVHGHEDNDELRNFIRDSLQPEPKALSSSRASQVEARP